MPVSRKTETTAGALLLQVKVMEHLQQPGGAMEEQALAEEESIAPAILL